MDSSVFEISVGPVIQVQYRTAPDRVRSLGIDSETLLREEDIAEIAGSVGTDEEIKRATSAFACNRLGLTVLFSAKESLLKCLYPIVARWFDFRQARLADSDAELARSRSSC